MEGDVWRWSLEFLIGKSKTDSNLIKKMIRRIPVSDSDNRLKKAILLRTLEDELSKASIAEWMLATLEVLEELLRCDGSPISAAMRAAYCGIAVECTLKYLEVEKSHPSYLKAVERIWRVRVQYMEPSSSSAEGRSLLFSAEWKRWRSDIEASLKKPRVMDRLAATVNTRRDAINKLKVYLAEAWANVGPSFLEVTAERLHRLTGNLVLVGPTQEMGMSVNDSPAGEQQQQRVSPVESQKDNQLHKGKCTTGDVEMDPSTTCSKIDSVPSHEVPKIGSPAREHQQERVSPVEIQMDKQLHDKGKCTSTGAEAMDPSTTCSSKIDSVRNHEVPQIGESRECGSLELQTFAKDCLPNSFCVSDIAKSKLANKDMNQEHPMENQSRDANVPESHACQSVDNNEANLNETTDYNQSDVHRPSLMEPNSTARTHEWDDSIGGLQGGTSNHANIFHLPSPKRNKISPLRNYEEANITKRRKRKKWSQLEEEALRTAVSKIGRGNWKLILNSYKDVFEERTEVDLKDKWRNMTRYGGK